MQYTRLPAFTSPPLLVETDCAEEGDPTAPDRTAFRSRTGSLLWLCRGALPIIGYHVAALSRMNHAPGKKHWRASSDVLRYLATSGDARIIYQRTNGPRPGSAASRLTENWIGPFGSSGKETVLCIRSSASLRQGNFDLCAFNFDL